MNGFGVNAVHRSLRRAVCVLDCCGRLAVTEADVQVSVDLVVLARLDGAPGPEILAGLEPAVVVGGHLVIDGHGPRIVEVGPFPCQGPVVPRQFLHRHTALDPPAGHLETHASIQRGRRGVEGGDGLAVCGRPIDRLHEQPSGEISVAGLGCDGHPRDARTGDASTAEVLPERVALHLSHERPVHVPGQVAARANARPFWVIGIGAAERLLSELVRVRLVAASKVLDADHDREL